LVFELVLRTPLIKMEKSFLQLQAESAAFDADARIEQQKRLAAGAGTRVVEVPHFQPTRVDARDPDADWAGRVVKDRGMRRRPAEEHVSIKDSLAAEAGGLVPRECAGGAAAQQHALHNVVPRRHFGHDIRFSSSNEDGQGAPLNSAVYPVGPGGRHDCSGWQTSAQALQQGAATTRDAYEEGKGLNRGGRRRIVPQFESGAQVCLARDRAVAAAASSGRGGGALSTWGRSRGRGNMNMLAGVGKSALTALSSDDRQRLAALPR